MISLRGGCMQVEGDEDEGEGDHPFIAQHHVVLNEHFESWAGN